MNSEARSVIEKEIRKCENRANHHRSDIEKHLDCILDHRTKILLLDKRRLELMRALDNGEQEMPMAGEENGKSEASDEFEVPDFIKELLGRGKATLVKVDLSK